MKTLFKYRGPSMEDDLKGKTYNLKIVKVGDQTGVSKGLKYIDI